jgi:hypothetical protein
VNYRQWSWIVTGAALIGVEVAALIRGDPLLTDAMRAGAARWISWPALLGCLGGHFFGQRISLSWGPWLLAALGVALLARDLFFWQRNALAPQFEVFLIFAGLGSFLWGSR